MYPTQVNFTIKGDTEFKTLLGGVVSAVVRCFVFIAALILSVSIFQRSKVNVSINTVFKDLTYDSEKHYFAKDKVFFALKMRGPDSDKLLDPTYFKFEFNQVHYELSSNEDGYTYSLAPIEYEL